MSTGVLKLVAREWGHPGRATSTALRSCIRVEGLLLLGEARAPPPRYHGGPHVALRAAPPLRSLPSLLMCSDHFPPSSLCSVPPPVDNVTPLFCPAPVSVFGLRQGRLTLRGVALLGTQSGAFPPLP